MARSARSCELELFGSMRLVPTPRAGATIRTDAGAGDGGGNG